MTKLILNISACDQDHIYPDILQPLIPIFTACDLHKYQNHAILTPIEIKWNFNV